MRRAATIGLAVFMAASGCTATIAQTHGPAYEAKIVSSDESSIDLLGSDGAVYRIPRAEVRSIDHPGNVLIVVGLATLAHGIVPGAMLMADGKTEIGLAVLAAYAVPALVMTVLGAVPYHRSKKAARRFESPSQGW